MAEPIKNYNRVRLDKYKDGRLVDSIDDGVTDKQYREIKKILGET